MDIFGIAEDNNVKGQAGLLFKLLKAAVNFIQVISFGGRPGFGVDNFNNLGVGLTDLVNLSLSFRIIRIDADKNKIIAVIDGVEVLRSMRLITPASCQAGRIRATGFSSTARSRSRVRGLISFRLKI